MTTTTSGWPWMKGIHVAVADPAAPPVCPDDDRPAVQDLIVQHRDKIDKIAAGLKDDPLYIPTKHDDLWILRFWLSHRKSKKAIEAAKTALEFRAKHKLDDHDIRDVPPHRVLSDNDDDNDDSSQQQPHPVPLFLSYTTDGAIRYAIPDQSRGVIALLNMVKMNQAVLVREQPASLWLPVFTYFSEWTFQWLDYVTRTTGRLTKSIRLADMSNVGLSHISREFVGRVGKAMEVMEDCYPQLLDGVYVCNPPSVLHVLWTMVRPILPKRVLAKIDFISPAHNAKERKRLHRYISQQLLPTEFGGMNTTPVTDW